MVSEHSFTVSPKPDPTLASELPKMSTETELARSQCGQIDLQRSLESLELAVKKLLQMVCERFGLDPIPDDFGNQVNAIPETQTNSQEHHEQWIEVIGNKGSKDLEKWVDPVVGLKSSNHVFGGSTSPPTRHRKAPDDPDGEKISDEVFELSSHSKVSEISHATRSRYLKKLGLHKVRKKEMDISDNLGFEASVISSTSWLGVNKIRMDRQMRKPDFPLGTERNEGVVMDVIHESLDGLSLSETHIPNKKQSLQLVGINLVQENHQAKDWWSITLITPSDMILQFAGGKLNEDQHFFCQLWAERVWKPGISVSDRLKNHRSGFNRASQELSEDLERYDYHDKMWEIKPKRHHTNLQRNTKVLSLVVEEKFVRVVLSLDDGRFKFGRCLLNSNGDARVWKRVETGLPRFDCSTVVLGSVLRLVYPLSVGESSLETIVDRLGENFQGVGTALEAVIMKDRATVCIRHHGICLSELIEYLIKIGDIWTDWTTGFVGDDRMKARNIDRHVTLPCIKQGMSRLIPDIISLYNSGDITIIVTESKVQSSELARALYGNIQRSQGEISFAGFGVHDQVGFGSHDNGILVEVHRDSKTMKAKSRRAFVQKELYLEGDWWRRRKRTHGGVHSRRVGREFAKLTRREHGMHFLRMACKAAVCEDTSFRVSRLKVQKKGVHSVTINIVGYITKATRPQDIITTLLNHLKYHFSELKGNEELSILIYGVFHFLRPPDHSLSMLLGNTVRYVSATGILVIKGDGSKLCLRLEEWFSQNASKISIASTLLNIPTTHKKNKNDISVVEKKVKADPEEIKDKDFSARDALQLVLKLLLDSNGEEFRVLVESAITAELHVREEWRIAWVAFKVYDSISNRDHRRAAWSEVEDREAMLEFGLLFMISVFNLEDKVVSAGEY